MIHNYVDDSMDPEEPRPQRLIVVGGSAESIEVLGRLVGGLPAKAGGGTSVVQDPNDAIPTPPTWMPQSAALEERAALLNDVAGRMRRRGAESTSGRMEGRATEARRGAGPDPGLDCPRLAVRFGP
ncbi:hypothetical protein BH23ACT12_BH23ACT12_23350 [soil metagenome]